MEKENVTMVECDTRGCTTLVPDPGTRWERCNPNVFGVSSREVPQRAACEECTTRWALEALEYRVRDLERQAKARAARHARELEECPF